MRKHKFYQAATFLWVLVSAAAVITAYTGNAEPVVSPSQLPGGPAYLFGGILLAMIAGVTANVVLVNRSWKAMGQKSNLTPDGEGLPIGKPDLTGTVDGRNVRARTITRKKSTSGGSEGGSGTTKVTYTVVEADLAEPVDDGFMIGRGDGESVERVDVGNGSIVTTAIDDTFHIVGGGSEELARNALSQRARNALVDVETVGVLTLGDPRETVLDAIPDTSGSFLGDALAKKMKSKVMEEFPGDPGTVANETKGVLLDPDELERQATAVAAVADSFENATAQAPRA